MTAEHPWRDLAPLAALGVLDGGEALSFRSHVASCTACRAEFETYERVVGEIGASVRLAAPPPTLRPRILSLASPSHSRSRRGAPRWALSLAAAIALGLGVALVVTRIELSAERRRTENHALELRRAAERLRELESALREARAINALVTGAESRLTLLAGLSPRSARARVFWNAVTREALLIAVGLEMPAAGRDYEIWVIPEGGAPVPAGVFRPRSDGTAVVNLSAPALDAPPRTFAVTLEPSGGGPAPTGPMVLAGNVF